MTFNDYSAIAEQDDNFSQADAWADLQALRASEANEDGELDCSQPEDAISDNERWALDDTYYRGEASPEW